MGETYRRLHIGQYVIISGYDNTVPSCEMPGQLTLDGRERGGTDTHLTVGTMVLKPWRRSPGAQGCRWLRRVADVGILGKSPHIWIKCSLLFRYRKKNSTNLSYLQIYYIQ